MSSSAWSICPWNRPPAITTAAIARATICTARAWCAWISRPASANGISNWCTIPSGTWTSPPRPLLADINVNGRADQGGGAAHQAGLPVRLRPRHRQAGLAHRGARRGEGQRARRMVFAHAAVPHAARALQPQRHFRGRSDRFHTGAARPGAHGDREIQDRSGLYAAGGKPGRRTAGDSHAGHRQRRHQLARRFLRSGDAHGVRVCVQRLRHADRAGAVAERDLRHALHRRHCGTAGDFPHGSRARTPAPILPWPVRRTGGGGRGGRRSGSPCKGCR